MSESMGRSFGGSTGLVTFVDDVKFSGKKSADVASENIGRTLG
jgi:hypothetical protein